MEKSTARVRERPSHQCRVYGVRGWWPMAVRFAGGRNESLLHLQDSKDWPDWDSKGKKKRQTHGHAEKLGSGGLGSIVRNHSNPDQYVYYMQLNREAGLLYMAKERGRDITDRQEGRAMMYC